MVKSFTIRISDELNKWLEERAEIEHRNKNNLVVHLLENVKRLDKGVIDTSWPEFRKEKAE